MTKATLHAFSQKAKRIWGYASTTHALSAKASHIPHGVVQPKKGNGITRSLHSPTEQPLIVGNTQASKAFRQYTQFFSSPLEELRCTVAPKPKSVPVSKTIKFTTNLFGGNNTMFKISNLFVSLVLVVALSACSDNNPVNTDPVADKAKTKQATAISDDMSLQATTTEGFEGATKGSYTAGTVTLGTGSYTLTEALIGNLTTDRKNGAQSARIRDLGRVTMNFNRTTGAGTVTVRHAVFGTDGASSFELWMSTNSGTSWSRVGSAVTVSSTTLQTATFTVNVGGTVRFEIRKVSGGANRINIDDITITSSTGGTTPPPPTGGTTPPPTSSNEHMVMGNPDGAIASTSSPARYLMEKPQYALSYNRDKGIPNWVSWRADVSWMGSTPRQDDFRADNTLPSGWYQVGGTSYSGSGFDRGHNCASADRTNSVATNSSTFLMTNIIPQAPDNNQGPWVSLENYMRTLVGRGNECYVIMGQYGVGGTGSGGFRTTIDGGRVTVPNRTWKVIVVLPVGSGDDAARVTTATRVIAVDMPNTQGIRNNSWSSYRTTVDAIEQAAGVDIMSRVSASVQSVLESRVDNGPVQ